VLADANNTPLAIAAIVSLVIGYGGIYALWHFIFRPKRHHDDDVDRLGRVDHTGEE
jgi:hypothetical protein